MASTVLEEGRDKRFPCVKKLYKYKEVREPIQRLVNKQSGRYGQTQARWAILEGFREIGFAEDSIERVYMYAVIKTGGKQYKVASGEKIKVEQIAADVGQEIVIDQVLAVGNGSEIKVGTPLVSGATVTVTVLAHGRHDKVRIFKMRRRKHYQKRQGHRQNFTELQIGVIAG